MVRYRVTAALMLLFAALGCERGGGRSAAGVIAPVERKTVVWLVEDLDEETARRLQSAGVDEVVVRRGELDLSGSAPVFRLRPGPSVAGSIPVGMALEVVGVRSGLGSQMAEAVWRALAAEVGDATPAEIILDLPQLRSGMAGFVEHFSRTAGVPVVPILAANQLRHAEAPKLVAAARACVVPGYGVSGTSLRGLPEAAVVPLAERLGPLAGLGARVRLAVALTPRTEPRIDGWGDDLNPLTEPDAATASTSSILDRSFSPRREIEWSGRRWQQDEEVAVRWFDAARLHASFAEMNRLVLPELGGWDLVPLPPEGSRLGITREAMIRYLGGEGPGPSVDVSIERTRATVKARMVNTSPFGTAVSGVGSWLEVSVSSGALDSGDRGTFDRVVAGTLRDGEWQPTQLGAPDAARFHETYLAPGEDLETGWLRLSSSRTSLRLRWQLQLSSGDSVTGSLVEE